MRFCLVANFHDQSVIRMNVFVHVVVREPVVFYV